MAAALGAPTVFALAPFVAPIGEASLLDEVLSADKQGTPETADRIDFDSSPDAVRES
jgi:hypothetical protein